MKTLITIIGISFIIGCSKSSPTPATPTSTAIIPAISNAKSSFNFVYDKSNNLTLIFTNTSTSAVRYKWDFGDGDTSNSDNPSHTFKQKNRYIITLLAFDSLGVPSNNTVNIPAGSYSSSIIFWANKSVIMNYPMVVAFNNQTQVITSFLWNDAANLSSLHCGDAGFANFMTQIGTYDWIAQAQVQGSTQIKGTVTLTDTICYKQHIQ